MNWRTNNALVQAYNVNSLNELTTSTNSGTLTVAGSATETPGNPGLSGVTVNGQAASV